MIGTIATSSRFHTILPIAQRSSRLRTLWTRKRNFVFTVKFVVDTFTFSISSMKTLVFSPLLTSILQFTRHTMPSGKDNNRPDLQNRSDSIGTITISWIVCDRTGSVSIRARPPQSLEHCLIWNDWAIRMVNRK